jgi:hypothetical protein
VQLTPLPSALLLLLLLLLLLHHHCQVTFTIGSEGAPWLKRTYKSLTSAAVEVGDSRMYGGVHFPSANADGLALGRLVAGRVLAKMNSAGSSSGTATTTEKSSTAQGRRRHQRLLLGWW